MVSDVVSVDGIAGAGRPGDPPLLTGGSLQGESLILGPEGLLSAKVDFLTVTVPPPSAEWLMRVTDEEELGGARPGFSESEKRACLGGMVWRRWSPTAPSKQWGLDYESWEWDGPGSSSAARQIREAGVTVRASRVDLAFDFKVDAAVMSDDVIALCRSESDPDRAVGGATIGVAGQGSVRTWYVGSAKSERRIRIYRKDLRDPSFEHFIGPVIRIELTMRKKFAAAFFSLYVQDPEAAVAAAATYVAEMSGLVVSEGGPVPELDVPEMADSAQQVMAFLRQHGDRLAMWEEAGVPVMEFAREHASRPGRTRMALSRTQRRLDQIRRVGVQAVNEAVYTLLCRRSLPSEPLGPSGG